MIVTLEGSDDPRDRRPGLAAISAMQQPHGSRQTFAAAREAFLYHLACRYADAARSKRTISAGTRPRAAAIYAPGGSGSIGARRFRSTPTTLPTIVRRYLTQSDDRATSSLVRHRRNPHLETFAALLCVARRLAAGIAAAAQSDATVTATAARRSSCQHDPNAALVGVELMRCTPASIVRRWSKVDSPAFIAQTILERRSTGGLSLDDAIAAHGGSVRFTR